MFAITRINWERKSENVLLIMSLMRIISHVMSLKMKLHSKYAWTLYPSAMNLIMKMISLFFHIFNLIPFLILMIICFKFIGNMMVIIFKIFISRRFFVIQLREIHAMSLQLLKMFKKMMSIFNKYWKMKRIKSINLLDWHWKIWLKNKMLKLY